MLFFLLRRLIDEPATFPNLTLLSVFRDQDGNAQDEGRSDCIGIRIAAHFPAALLCPRQLEVGQRLRQSFGQGMEPERSKVMQRPTFFQNPRASRAASARPSGALVRGCLLP